ncbi:hypothetical protein M514_00933 [Trichuris suis]|uniref:Protein kinase domain-containing protein n=1 Tax=Trichuris suis TaxID=68888 RepID=A0A085MWD7_9BILA|nr:hypothetical protein M514_00933 [Trichuris suis]
MASLVNSYNKSKSPSLERIESIEQLEDYKKLCKVGEGTYGAVYKAVQRTTGEIVALKKFRLDEQGEGVPNTCLREISTLKRLNHPNIIKLLQVFHTSHRLFLVLELMDYDLKALIASVRGEKFHPQLVKVTLKPLFPGTSEIDQLFSMFRLLGTPDDSVWPGISQLAVYSSEFPKWKTKGRLSLVSSAMPENGADLLLVTANRYLFSLSLSSLQKMIAYRPETRIKAKSAISHVYFRDIDVANVAKFMPSGQEHGSTIMADQTLQ